MPDKYYLVESGALEKLLRTHFMLTQSTLLFEHLLSHSDRPMFLSARKVCEVLGLDRHQLEQCRKKRMIRAVGRSYKRRPTSKSVPRIRTYLASAAHHPRRGLYARRHQ